MFGTNKAIKLTLLMLVVLGILLRLIWLVGSGEVISNGPDSMKYVAGAMNLIKNGLLSNNDVIRLFGIGYPLYLYIFLKLGIALFYIVLFQIILYAFVTYTFSMRLKVIFGSKVSVIVACFLSLSPLTIDSIASLMYEAPALIITISFYSYVLKTLYIKNEFTRGSKINIIILLWILAFLHPRYFILSLMFLVIVFLHEKILFKISATVIVSTSIFIQLIRNKISENYFNISGNGGYTFMVGTNSFWSENWKNLCPDLIYIQPQYTSAWDNQIYRCAFRIISDNPIRWIALLPKKMLEHFEPFFLRFLDSNLKFEEVLFSGPRVIQIISTSFFLFIFLYSLTKYRFTSNFKQLELLFYISFMFPLFTSLLYFGYARYRILSMPLFYLYLALFLERLNFRFSSKESSKPV